MRLLLSAIVTAGSLILAIAAFAQSATTTAPTPPATTASFAGGGRRLGPVMVALAAGHDAAVQRIDTSVVRVDQHGACIARNRRQSMGRSRGGLTSEIHAVVDANGLPVPAGADAW